MKEPKVLIEVWQLYTCYNPLFLSFLSLFYLELNTPSAESYHIGNELDNQEGNNSKHNRADDFSAVIYSKFSSYM